MEKSPSKQNIERGGCGQVGGKSKRADEQADNDDAMTDHIREGHKDRLHSRPAWLFLHTTPPYSDP